jgi:hemolysin activation/secretion protein
MFYKASCKGKVCKALVVSGAILLSIPAFAQQNRTPDDIGQRYLEEQRKKREMELLQQKPTVIERQPLQQITPRPGEECFSISSINLVDNTKLKKKQVDKIFAPYLKEGCIRESGIRGLMIELTNLYIKNGYVTSKVYIKKTDLSDGNLELVSVEGKVEDVTINEGEKGWFAWKNKTAAATAFPRLKGKVLNIRDFEQGADQINRLSSSKAEVKLYPGDEVGTTKVKVTNKQADKYRGYVGYDNFGQKNTGEQRAKMIFEGDDIFGLNDSMNLTYIGSNNTNAIASSFSVPVGYWTHRIDYSYSEYLTLVDNIAELFGTTWNAAYTANRVIYRGTNSKTSVEGVLNMKESGRIINDVILSPQPLTVTRLGIKHNYRGDGYYVTADGTYSKGIKAMGALHDPTGLGSDSPHAQFDKIDTSIEFNKRLPAALVFNTSMNVQYAWQSLYGSEQVAMGDYYTVRGYSGSNVAGDIGGYLRNDITWYWSDKAKEMLPEKLTSHVQPFIFADAGGSRLRFNHKYKNIAGAGGGIKFNIWRLSGEMGIAFPVAASDSIKTEDTEIYVSILAKTF